MAVKIRLKRMGKVHSPHYRVVVADSRTRRDGRAIEEIGYYAPKENPSLIKIDSERALHWLSVGAQPTPQVEVLLKLTGDWGKFTGKGDTENKVLPQQPKPVFAPDAAKPSVLRERSGTSKKGKAAGEAAALEEASAKIEEKANPAEAPEKKNSEK